MKQDKNQKPLTLDALASYNREVLFPWMEERFATKSELKELKTEFKGFKNKTITSQDKILRKLDILLDEKTVREYQENKEKKFWAILVKAMQEHRILSSGDLQEISHLEIF